MITDSSVVTLLKPHKLTLQKTLYQSVCNPMDKKFKKCLSARIKKIEIEVK